MGFTNEVLLSTSDETLISLPCSTFENHRFTLCHLYYCGNQNPVKYGYIY